MKIKFIAFIISFSLAIPSLYAQLTLHTRYEAKIEIPNTINIKDCLKWHVNFKRIKNAVYYYGNIIAMGKTGGFMSINPKTFEINNKLNQKLNSDIFTNVIVRGDTLIAESYNGLYFLNQDTIWEPYNLKEKIFLFHIAFEDSSYVFSTIDNGEYGDALYIYDKASKETKIILGYSFESLNVFKSITKTNCGYSISHTLRNGWACKISSSVQIDSLESQDNYDFYIDYEETGKQWYLGPDFLKIPKKNNYYPLAIKNDCKCPDQNIYITSQYSNSVGVFKDDTGLNYWLSLTDTISRFSSNKKDGFTIIKNDTLIKVDFIMQPTSFKTKWISDDLKCFMNLNGKMINIDDKLTSFVDYERDGYYVTKRSFKAKLKNGTSIDWQKTDTATYYTDSSTKFHISYNNQLYNIAIKSKMNQLEKFFIHNNMFFFIETLGNINHKYGTFEITDLEKFLQEYGEKIE